MIKIVYLWVKKFGYALKGLFVAFREESSLLVHLAVSASLIVLGIVARDFISAQGWAVLALACVLNIVVELVNTVVENTVDLISFKYNVNAKKIKDISAAATLLMSIGALAGGLAIVVPALISFAGN